MVYLFVKVIVQCRVNIGRQAITTSSLSEAVEASGLGHNTSIDATVEAAMAFWHSIYIRTVSSYHLLSALFNWFKLVNKPFGQSKMHRSFNFCPD